MNNLYFAFLAFDYGDMYVDTISCSDTSHFGKHLWANQSQTNLKLVLPIKNASY